MSKNETTALAKVDVNQFLALTTPIADVQAVLAEAAGTEGITPFDLDRVKMPAGGSISWEVPTIDGQPDSTKEISGVVIYTKQQRAYWPGEYKGGSEQPQCFSDDAVTGQGEPAGICADCDFAQFGTSSNKRGQACKLVRLIFVLREDSLLPLVIILPPGSLKTWKKYQLRLAGRGITPSGVVTSIALEKVKNDDGIAYSRIMPKMAGALDNKQKEIIEAYKQGLIPSLDSVRVSADDIDPTTTDTE